MKKTLIALASTACIVLQADSLSYIPQPYMLVGDSVLPNDKPYYKYDNTQENFQLLFPKEHLQTAQHAFALDSKIVPDYAKLYGWHFDETLHVGLISSHSQVANGFSTQWPNNRQINYVGGVGMIDYFCSASWLDTLLYHETAHNYQINIKESIVSQTLHSIFGNGMTFGLWTMPNLAVNPFMLEGNAVLNESWHGNGGRLYSGRFKAETILQAQAGNVTPAKLYNQRLAFPYGDIHYIQGGFYNYFLAKKYGLDAANSFFRHNSHFWFWPFMTNRAMKRAVGIDFEESVEEFSKSYKQLAKDFVILQGEEVTTSQFFAPLNRDKKEVFCLINEDGVSEGELLSIDKKSLHVSKKKGAWLRGKMFFIDGKYYTAASRHTSVTRITQGLFDKDAFLKKGTASKAVQSVLEDKTIVYFDTNSSFVLPQLYVKDTFYTQANSSVVSDTQGNIYYFVQRGKTRTLYKNKTALFSYKGFYGIVSDIDENGKVYFIASSKLGSTLYAYKDGHTTRVLRADNIIDAKLLDNQKLFVVSIGAQAYHYMIVSEESFLEEPYETKLFFEETPRYKKYTNFKKTYQKVDTNSSYIPFFEMHYNGTEITYGATDSQQYGSINVKFADPLSQNAAQFFYQKDDLGIDIIGTGYSSSEYLLHYKLQVYKTLTQKSPYKTNDMGFMANITLPLYQAGYYYSDIGISYFEDYLAKTRKPLSTTLFAGIQKRYGVSMFDNFVNNIKLYGVVDRDYTVVGGNYNFFHDLGKEFYGGAEVKYSYSDATSGYDAKGIKLTSSYSFEDLYDPSVLLMPSFNALAYVAQGGYGGISLYKTLHFSKYYFTFPLSLQREAIYTKYRYYKLKDFRALEYDANEMTFGLRVDSVVLNDVVVPVVFEYIYNDANFIQDSSSFRFYISLPF